MGLLERFLGKPSTPPSSEGGKDGAAPEASAAAPPDLEAKAATLTDPPVSFIPRDAAGNTIESPLYAQAQLRADVTRSTAFMLAAYCYVAMRFRAEAEAEAPLMVVEETEDGEEWLEDHELGAFLDEPSPDFDMSELIYLTRLYRDMTGMAVWVKDTDRGGRTGRLTPFHGDEFRVEKSADRIYGRFVVTTAKGDQPFDPEQIVFFREIHPGDWWHGLGWVEAALASVNLGQNVVAIARQLLRNAVWPSLAVQADPKWNPTEQEWERYKAEIDAYSRLDQKGKALVLLGGGSATVLSAKLAELVPGELLDRVEATVSACSGVPAVVLQYLVGLKNSPWSQMEEARRMAYEDVIERLWKRTEKVLTRQLLRDVDDDPSHYIRFDRSRITALKADDTKRASVITSLVDVWTINQALIYTGQEPRDDELGDMIISHARSRATPVPAVRSFNYNGGEDEEQPEEEEKRRERLRLERKSDFDREIARIVFDMQARSQEDAWESAVAKQLERDQAKISEMAERAFAEEEGKAWKDNDPARRAAVRRLIADVEAYTPTARREWKGTVEPLIRLTSRAAVRSAAEQVGVGFDLLIQGLVGYTEQHAAHLVSQITATTREELASSLATGLEKGESMAKLRKRVQQSDAAFGRSRAQLIARTETTGVANGAQHLSLEKYASRTGAEATKEWLDAGDGRTRDSHAAIGGEKRKINERFSNGLRHPGDPTGDPAEVCNCRCTLIYSVQKQEAAA
jgi:SPP1 gp7 family putative phage head morphogenesis protein